MPCAYCGSGEHPERECSRNQRATKDAAYFAEITHSRYPEVLRLEFEKILSEISKKADNGEASLWYTPAPNTRDDLIDLLKKHHFSVKPVYNALGMNTGHICIKWEHRNENL